MSLTVQEMEEVIAGSRKFLKELNFDDINDSLDKVATVKFDAERQAQIDKAEKAKKEINDNIQKRIDMSKKDLIKFSKDNLYDAKENSLLETHLKNLERLKRELSTTGGLVSALFSRAKKIEEIKFSLAMVKAQIEIRESLAKVIKGKLEKAFRHNAADLKQLRETIFPNEGPKGFLERIGKFLSEVFESFAKGFAAEPTRSRAPLDDFAKSSNLADTKTKVEEAEVDTVKYKNINDITTKLNSVEAVKKEYQKSEVYEGSKTPWGLLALRAHANTDADPKSVRKEQIKFLSDIIHKVSGKREFRKTQIQFGSYAPNSREDSEKMIFKGYLLFLKAELENERWGLGKWMGFTSRLETMIEEMLKTPDLQNISAEDARHAVMQYIDKSKLDDPRSKKIQDQYNEMYHIDKQKPS